MTEYAELNTHGVPSPFVLPKVRHLLIYGLALAGLAFHAMPVALASSPCEPVQASSFDFLKQPPFVKTGWTVKTNGIENSCQVALVKACLFRILITSVRRAYPSASLVVASSSLFFCEPSAFDVVWDRIDRALAVGGIFCGDFLGPKDSWANDTSRTQTVVTSEKLTALFRQYDVIQWEERDELGITALRSPKHWHTFTVVARKRGLPNSVDVP